MRKVLFIVACIATLQLALCLRIAPPSPPKPCSLCKYHPCAATLCGPGTVATPDFCSCTCQCKPCFACLAVLCYPGRCKANEKCVQASCGCSYKCIPNCPTNKCAHIKCGFGAKCVQDQKTCLAKCECPRFCISIFKPVCGSDGKTYSNDCSLGVQTCKTQGKVRKISNGPCPVTCPDKCKNSKCKSYGALCRQNKKNCKIRCECPLRRCPYIYRPVCGTDGRTYHNDCILAGVICRSKGRIRKAKNGRCIKCPNKCKNSKCKSYGAWCRQDKKTCKIRCVCPLRRCANINKPVCGTDGKTYRNNCILAGVICRSKGRIRKAKNGRCKPLCKFHNPCAGIKCGSKKRCVPNFGACAYSCQPKVCPIQQCVQPACAGNPCVVGKCIEICKNSCVAACEITRGCDRPCTKEYDPYCALNGQTYGNFCMFKIAQCKSGNTLRIKKKGVCH